MGSYYLLKELVKLNKQVDRGVLDNWNVATVMLTSAHFDINSTFRQHLAWSRKYVALAQSFQLIMLTISTDRCVSASWPHVDFDFPCTRNLLFRFRTVAFHLHPIIYQPRIHYGLQWNAVLYKNNEIYVPCWLL
jgi:hypothetical protein